MKAKIRKRIIAGIAKYRKMLVDLRNDNRENEEDTVRLIIRIFENALGYDAFKEVRSQYEIGTAKRCDLAVTVNSGKYPTFLVECKRVGKPLNQAHIEQVVDYAGREKGTEWAILTNGLIWMLYHVSKKGVVKPNLIFTINIDESKELSDADIENFYAISKEGYLEDATERLLKNNAVFNKYVVGSVVMTDEVVKVIRRKVNSLSDGVKIDEEELRKILSDEVFNCEILDKSKDGVKEAKRLIVRNSNDNTAVSHSKQDGITNRDDSQNAVTPQARGVCGDCVDFALTGRGITVNGKSCGKGFTLYAGSKILEPVPCEVNSSLGKLKCKLEQEGIIKDGILAVDYEFNSPSQAAGIALGRASNGQTEWKTTAGKSFREVFPKT